ncbi:Os1348 family NHLP clan protein [Bradyrhizobium sp.]|uniref:Os1348 family NHLP clan protein n=1 Tax=Bradyrhizobium sp. TaxID=376 RepID=UPI0025C12E88|nr:Os1348 family NHLP clan protein [Bradyrhizobium sp.]
MAEQQPGHDTRPAPSRQLTELLSRALLDEQLRDRLFVDPEAMAREFDLPPAESRAIHRLDRRKFEQTVARLRWG